jgi:hypothetical protein
VENKRAAEPSRIQFEMLDSEPAPPIGGKILPRAALGGASNKCPSLHENKNESSGKPKVKYIRGRDDSGSANELLGIAIEEYVSEVSLIATQNEWHPPRKQRYWRTGSNR